MSRVLKGDREGGDATKPERVQRVIDAEVFEAKEEAHKILEAARAEAERLKAEAWREGHTAGRDEGLAHVTELLVRARAEALRQAEATEPELRRLAVRIAEKVLGRELAQDPGAIVDVVRAALAAARARRELTIRVHPDDVPALQAAHPRLAAALVRHADIAVVADPAVARGGCTIDTEVGTIDARLDVQLQAIERALCGEPP